MSLPLSGLCDEPLDIVFPHLKTVRVERAVVESEAMRSRPVLVNILREHGINPSPEHDRTTGTAFPRSRARAIVARDFFKTRPRTGA